MKKTTALTAGISALAISASGLAAFASIAQADPGQDNPDKIWVCKYTQTPGGPEVLKPGNDGLVWVSKNSIEDKDPQVGEFWIDGQEKSVVIQVGGPRPALTACPAPKPTPTPTPTPSAPVTTPSSPITTPSKTPSAPVSTPPASTPVTTPTTPKQSPSAPTSSAPAPSTSTATVTQTVTTSAPNPGTTTTSTKTTVVTAPGKAPAQPAGSLARTGAVADGNDIAGLAAGAALLAVSGVAIARRKRNN